MFFSVVIGILFPSLASLTVCDAKVINGKCVHSTFTILYLVAIHKSFFFFMILSDGFYDDFTIYVSSSTKEVQKPGLIPRPLLPAIIAPNLLPCVLKYFHLKLKNNISLGGAGN